MTSLAAAVTALFVPGNRPDRFAKAARAGADLVIIDLEDAVAPVHRAEALAHTIQALDPATGLAAVVRITDVSSPTHHEELRSLVRLTGTAGHGLLAVMVPKAANPADLTQISRAFTDAGSAVPVIALIESAAGVASALDLAGVDGVARLAFGALDLSLDLGIQPDSQVVAVAQAQLVIASRAAGLPAPLDTPSVEIADVEAVSAAARASRALGFGGKLCIHPAQLAPTRAAFRPTAAEARWAEDILAAAGDDAAQVGGRMVDRPVLERARLIHNLLQESS
ncbi:MAG: CoA ester lyase [Microlunatus sp.]